MISANHFIFRSDRTMLAAREDPGEAGLMGPQWFPSATPRAGGLGHPV
jgi:hypothetical protein